MIGGWLGRRSITMPMLFLALGAHTGTEGLGWLASTLIAFGSFHEIARPHQSMFAIAGWTILLSVVLHGFSALPLASWYANRLEKAPQAIPELMEVPDLES